jgi:ATP-dependent Clp protease ATP-binding subunit ClpC
MENVTPACSVCGKRARSRITVAEYGQRRQLMLCDEHYMELMARDQGGLSPLGPLFHGGLFDGLSGDLWPQIESGRDSRSNRTLTPACIASRWRDGPVTAGS